MNPIDGKLKELQRTTQSFLRDLRESLPSHRQEPGCLSYFTYGIHIAHCEEEESFILGSFHIRNIGTRPLTNPVIHLLLSDDAPFALHGKFSSSAAMRSSQLTNGWERLNDRSDRHAFHLRPSGITSIDPDGTLAFTNFQLTWVPSATYAGSLTAIVFSEEYPDGVAAITSISINGSLPEKEELN